MTPTSSLFDIQTAYVLNSVTSFHADTGLASPYAGGFWNYGYQCGLYEEFQNPAPAVIPGSGGMLDASGCIYANGGNTQLDLPDSSQSAVYPARILAAFPDGSTHVLIPTNSPWGLTNGWSGTDWLGFVRGCQGETPATFPLRYVTDVGTFVRVTITGEGAGNVPAWTMVFPDGRQVTGLGATTQQIIDRNGNLVAISGSGPPCYSPQVSGDPLTTSSAQARFTSPDPKMLPHDPTDPRAGISTPTGATTH